MHNHFLDEIGVSIPVIQAPMAGACDAELVIAVCNAGGLGSLPCGMLSGDQIIQQVELIRGQTTRPFNLNFLCHAQPEINQDELTAWKTVLSPYYQELGLTSRDDSNITVRQSFNDEMCTIVEHLKPAVVSFHFGLPDPMLLERVNATGCVVLSSATTSKEAVFLEQRGVDAIIAQGSEAGGHRGMFMHSDISSQPGTMALIPQVVDAVSLPVIGAGGIGDGRSMAAALSLGASAVQIGTSYLFSNEARISEMHRQALENADDAATTVTNVFTGLPARGVINRLIEEVGPMNNAVPPFPLAPADLAPLRTANETDGKTDFTPLWSGQSVGLGKKYGYRSATDITREIAQQSQMILKNLANQS